MFQSFKFAFRGVKDAFKSEPNLKIHLLASYLVLNLGYALNISFIEWAILVLTITLVLVLELINTVIEKTVDIASPKISEKARLIKDISAACVLLGSISSLVIGCIIFIPKLISIWPNF